MGAIPKLTLCFKVLLSFTEGFSCVPTKFDSALVETPNKVDLIQTVAACELKESCYRVPYVEYYYEIVHHADGVKEERLRVGGNWKLSKRIYCLFLFLALINHRSCSHPTKVNQTFNQASQNGPHFYLAWHTYY